MKSQASQWAKAGFLAVFGGVAWALALPSWHWVWLLLPGAFSLASMFRFLPGQGSAFWLGVLAGFSHWCVAVSWVVEVMTVYGHLSGVLAAAALSLMSFILGLFWGLATWVAYLSPGLWRPLVLALGLAAGEMAQGLPPWDFPWNPLAAAFVPWPATLTGVSVIGSTLFGLLVRVTLFALAFALVQRRLKALTLAGGAALILLAATFPLSRTPLRQGPSLLVAAVQPDVPLEVRWDSGNLELIEDRVWNLSREAAQQGAQLVVWPESAVPRLLERDEDYRLKVIAFARQQRVWLVLNSIGFGKEGKYFNSMYVVSPSGEVHRYDKVHLVPFGEYVPSWARLFFLRPLVREVGGFTAGVQAQLLPGPGGALGGAVCYEVAFPLHAAAQVRAGAQLLVTVTNDGWYGNSAAPYQHLALAILRALETRRYLVRAANTGISAIVDANGQVVQKLGIGERGVIAERVWPVANVPLAVSWAGVLHLAPVVGFAVAILLTVRQKR